MAIDLSRVSRGTREKPPLALVYGPVGAGKTSFACGAPDALLLRAERGDGLLDVARFPLDHEDGGTDVFESWSDLQLALVDVYTNRPEFRSIILDSATSIEALLHRELERRFGCSLEQIHKGFGKWASEAAPLWWDLVNALRALNQQGRVVLLIAHAEVRPYMDPSGESYDQYLPRVHKAAREVLTSQLDHVLFLKPTVSVGREKLEFSKTRKYAAGLRRVLYTTDMPAFCAKNRLGLPPELVIPDDPTDPTVGWEVFARAAAAPAQAREAARIAAEAQEKEESAHAPSA